MNISEGAFALDDLLDHAQRVLMTSMHPAMAELVVDLARRGASAKAGGKPSHAAAVAPAEPLLTTKDAASRLKVSERHIYRLVSTGRLRSHHVGHRHRFLPSDIEALLYEIGPVARRVRSARLLSDARLGAAGSPRRAA